MPNVDIIVQPDGRIILPLDIQIGNDNWILWKRLPENKPFSLSFCNNPAVLGRVFISQLNPNNGNQELTTQISQGFSNQTMVRMFVSAIVGNQGQTFLSTSDCDVVIRR